MRDISLTEVMSGVKVVSYLNLLLLAVAVFMLALLAREYLARDMALSIINGSKAEVGARGTAGKGGFSRYAVIGSSGILGPSTGLRLLNSAPVKSQGPNPARSAAGNSQVTLLGTVTGAVGEGFAVFKDKSTGKEEVIRSGQSVFSIGRLLSVSRYSAIVQSGGRRLTFSMDVSEREMRKTGRPSPRGPGNLFSYSGGLNPFMGRPASKLAKPMGQGKWLVDKRALDSALADSNKVMGDARFYPYREGGKVKGFLISQVRSSGVFYGMGIRSGDIILRVNNYAIDAPEKAMSLIKGLKGETDVKLDILRRGKAQTFKYEIR